MKDICYSVCFLLHYYWLVNVDVDIHLKYKLNELNTNKHQILKSNLAAGE